MNGKRAARREELLDAACEYVAEHGITDLSLRPLAAALHTSDRMLLYYFASRNGLISAILERTAGQLQRLLTGVLPAGSVVPAALLEATLTAVPDERAQAALRLWLEVIGLSARGREPYAATARAVIGAWVSWLAERLDVPPGQHQAAAAALLAFIDGLIVTQVTGDLDAAAAAAWLIPQLRTEPS